MKEHVTIAIVICFLCSLTLVRGDQPTNNIEIKDVIISIQKQTTDLMDELEPLYNTQFVATRKAMTEQTARLIVQMILQGSLTNIQANIGVLLLSGLKEQTYWALTEPLLTTDMATNAQDPLLLKDLLFPPFPYGPAYANAYNIEWCRNRLLELKTKRPEFAFDWILSGEQAKAYADFLKNPEKHGYPDPASIHP